MLFLFLKYIAPTWYYNISSQLSMERKYFVDYRSLPQQLQQLLDLNANYRTEEAKLCDAAYQILQKGIMAEEAQPLHIIPAKRRVKSICLFGAQHIDIDQSVFVGDVVDNYRFVRRFFNPLHSLQILFIRLLSLHNPFKEIYGFLSAISTPRVELFGTNGFGHYEQEYVQFSSPLIAVQPKVSVVIPTLNRYDYLKDVLSDLEQQDYPNFEVIVVDQTDPFNADFYKGWKLDLQVLQQQEKALWLARNTAIRRAKGEYMLLYDDDSRVDSDWISQHLKCIDYFSCDISSGVSLSVVGAKVPPDYAYFKWSSQIDTGNVLFAKAMMKDTGMFDRQFERQRQGDGEYGLRSYLCGKTNVSNPLAKRIHLKVATGGLRQMGSWDGLRPTKLFAPRPVPSILYLCRKYFGNRIARLLLLMTVPASLTPYRYKGNKKMQLLSILSLVITFPVVFTQVMISWRRASLKLEEGDKIAIL